MLRMINSLLETYLEFYVFLVLDALDPIYKISKEAEKSLDYCLKYMRAYPAAYTDDFPVIEDYFRRLVLVMKGLKDKGKRIDIRNFKRIEKKINGLKELNLQ